MVMKSIITVAIVAALSLPAIADTYTGVVSDVKHFKNGGVAVDLDGHYPREKMALYVPPAAATGIGALPTEGTKVTATGTIGAYRGAPEIKILKPEQWKW
jgi:hypothetical protein